MNTNEYNSLRIIASANELPEGAEYYSWEHFDTRTVHQSWVTIYDEDFNALETARVKYTRALAGLSRIARHDDKDPVLLCYSRFPLNHQFDLIEPDDDTIALLETAARNAR